LEKVSDSVAFGIRRIPTLDA